MLIEKNGTFSLITVQAFNNCYIPPPTIVQRSSQEQEFCCFEAKCVRLTIVAAIALAYELLVTPLLTRKCSSGEAGG